MNSRITDNRKLSHSRTGQCLGNGITGKWSPGTPHSDEMGDLKGSVQHWLAVYPLEFEIPTFVAGVD
jgi:hypothetical protein